MVEAAAPIIEEFGPVAEAAVAGIGATAIAALTSIARAFAGDSLDSIINRTVQGYTIITNEYGGQAMTAGSTAAQAQAAQEAQRLFAEVDTKIKALCIQFINTRFISITDASAALTALSTAQAAPHVPPDIYAQLKSHYQAEINRLSGATVPAIVAPIKPGSTEAAVIQAAVAATLAGAFAAGGAAPRAGISEQQAASQAAALAGAGYLPTPLTSGQDITQALPGILAGALPLVGTSVISGLLANVLSIGNGLHSGSLQSQQSAAQKMLDLATSTLPALAGMALLEAPGIKDIITDPISNWMFSHLFTLPEIKKPMTPDQAPEVARALLERAISLGLAAHVASVSAEMSTPLKNMGLGYLAAFMSDMAGFSRIAALTMGIVEGQALGLPMRFYINREVRTEKPRMGDLLRLGEHYQLTELEFQELASYQGYDDNLIGKFWQIAHRPAGYLMLRRMAATGIWDEAYYTAALADSGFDLPTIDHGLSMLYAEAHGDLKTVGVGPAMTRFKEGLDTEGALVQNLTTLGIRQEMLPKYVFAANLSADYDQYIDYKAAWTDSVRKGLSTPDDFQAALIQRGLDPARAKLIADRERIRLYPTPKKQAA